MTPRIKRLIFFGGKVLKLFECARVVL
jgi:hypothetical protein